MSGGWKGSQRVNRLPPDWSVIRRDILDRDPVCRLAYDGCVRTSTQVDHVVAGDDHSERNLQGVCGPCHAVKSSREGNAARPTTRYPEQRHPGLRVT